MRQRRRLGDSPYQTLKGVCFFEAAVLVVAVRRIYVYQTLKGVCFFEAPAIVSQTPPSFIYTRR